MKNSLIADVDLQEDIAQNSEGIDQKVLIEAMKVDEAQLSEPLDGPSFILKLVKEGRL